MQGLLTVLSTGTYPLDVVRRRMQMKGATGELFKYNSTWHAFKVIVKSEGVYGLFKGMWPNLLKVKILYNAFFFIRQRQHEYPYHP